MEFTLRTWQDEDLNSLVKHANNKKIADNLTNKFPYPYTKQDGQNFISFAKDQSSHRIFAIIINNEACGGIGLHPQTDVSIKNAELGYWIGEQYWGKGIITKAIIEIVTYGFENLKIDRIFARPFGSNFASQRVLEKAGFLLEARFKNTFWKNDVYEDELVYAKRRK